MVKLFFVDVEAPFGVGSPAVGDMTEFGAVEFESRKSFHGKGCDAETMMEFKKWISGFGCRPVFVSDNVAYDWQWINFYFWKHFGSEDEPNPFGHSGRRISDFYAGLRGNFRRTQDWKRWRKTPHDHNPVNDAMGNVEAFAEMLAQYPSTGKS